LIWVQFFFNSFFPSEEEGRGGWKIENGWGVLYKKS
jgi:hypothetical protein